MLVLKVRNVEVALREACRAFSEQRGTVTENSRNGKVRRMDGVTVTEYERPDERVLFCPIRDANPFFHFFESLWMIAGRNDVEFPNQFCSGRMSAFSDNGKTLNGAYGARWRRHFGYDQLMEIVSNLRKNPSCRRQVLSMWDPREDLVNMDSKDVPCNDMATFQISDGQLDMVVFNRSNDLIWGAYGANAVHFSMLHEWMAMMIGCSLGKYTQVSSNTHVYEHHWDMVRRIADRTADTFTTSRLQQSSYDRTVASLPLLLQEDTPDEWNSDLEVFFRFGQRNRFRTRYFNQVVVPLFSSFTAYARKDKQLAIKEAEGCLATDWALAASQWLYRRNQ